MEKESLRGGSQWLPEKKFHRWPWPSAPCPCLEQRSCRWGSEGMRCRSLKQGSSSQREEREADGDTEPAESDTLGFKSQLGLLSLCDLGRGTTSSVGLSFLTCNMEQSHSLPRVTTEARIGVPGVYLEVTWGNTGHGRQGRREASKGYVDEQLPPCILGSILL